MACHPASHLSYSVLQQSLSTRMMTAACFIVSQYNSSLLQIHYLQRISSYSLVGKFLSGAIDPGRYSEFLFSSQNDSGLVSLNTIPQSASPLDHSSPVVRSSYSSSVSSALNWQIIGTQKYFWTEDNWNGKTRVVLCRCYSDWLGPRDYCNKKFGNTISLVNT